MPHDLAEGPDETVFDYAAIVVAAQGLGPLGTTWCATSSSTSSTATAIDEVARALVVRGVERGEPRGVLVRHARRVAPDVRRDRPPPSARSTTAASAARRPPRPAGSRSCSRTSRGRGAASTSSPPTPTAARRWTSGRRSRATAARAPRSGGPSGASPRRTSTRSATRCSPGRSCSRGMASARAGSRRCPTGWSPTTSRSSAGRRQLLHGGFGLRTIGELRKPRWWALSLLERLATGGCPCDVTGDGGGSLVEAWAFAGRRPRSSASYGWSCSICGPVCRLDPHLRECWFDRLVEP